jgi:predicted component of type VI protein secretion system
MKLVKFFALAVAAGAMFTACEPNEPNRPQGPADFAQAESKVYVDVTATGWENCNANEGDVATTYMHLN